jgi:hypothetical protein
MYTDIKTFEDACKVLNLESSTIIPDFSLFPESDIDAMIAHAKLIIIAKAINRDWTPDWTDSSQWKYYPWFKMGSSSGVGFSYDGYDYWATLSTVGSRLCFENREKAKYVGKQFQELYKIYFVK